MESFRTTWLAHSPSASATMNRPARRAVLAALFLAISIGAVSAQSTAAPVVRLVEFEYTVNPISAHRIIQAIDEAEAAGDSLVLIQLDTPGGLIESLNKIVKRMLNSKVPIVVWVGPSGARAASAGFFMVMAADVAAMAPGTRTGAASSIFGTGEGAEDNVLLKKMNQDNAALCRSMAERRGRSVDACEEAIFSARSYEESVALEQGLIDLIVSDRDALLAQLDGKEIRLFDGEPVVLHTLGATFSISEFSLKQRFMEMLAVPTIAILLLLIGLGGLWVEMTHPGVVLPGVVGALALLLFLLSAQVLPISAIGALLMLLALVMFLLEIKVVSHGMLTVGGVLSFTIGAAMLIDGPIPELRVPLPVVLPLSLTIALCCALALQLTLRARRTPVATGPSGLVGETGVVTRPLAPRGTVRAHGELWEATSLNGAIAAGESVRIARVDEMMLHVNRVADAQTKEKT